MKSPLLVLALVLVSSTSLAQGLLPLSGTYRIGRVWAEHGTGCGGPLDDSIGAEAGTGVFQPNGTWAASSVEHEVCQDGTVSTSGSGGAGVYLVGANGAITLDPGPNEVHMFASRNLQALVWAGDTLNQEPYVSLAIRAGAGLSTSVLTGSYHIAKCALANPGSGTRGELWNGTMTFTGAGAYAAAYQAKALDAAGGTSYTFPTASGTCAVLADGALTLSGLPGAATMSGAVTSDGAFFFALDATGQDVGLLVGVRFASAATNALLGGEWNGGNLYAGFGSGLFLPEFCSNSFAASVNAAISGYSTIDLEVCQDPTGVSSGSGGSWGSYAVVSDGATCIYDSSGTPCDPGAVDASGDYAFTVDMASGGEFGLAVYLRTPLPSLAYCIGDGSGAPCPCANHSAPGAALGCASSLGLGGKLRTIGVPSLSADSLVLQGTQMPNAPALYFQGTTVMNGGLGSPFGDGLRCAGGTIVRLGTKTNSGGGSQYPAAGDTSVSVRGAIGLPGTRSYQVWYRNSAPFCSAFTFNLTNGLMVVWGA